jgi:hypothetical protein
LTDPEAAPRAELAGLYRARWDLRTCIAVFATELEGPPRVTLRSTKPDGIAQEIWAFFCVQHAIRDFVTHSVHFGHPFQTRISFDTP